MVEDTKVAAIEEKVVAAVVAAPVKAASPFNEGPSSPGCRIGKGREGCFLPIILRTNLVVNLRQRQRSLARNPKVEC